MYLYIYVHSQHVANRVVFFDDGKIDSVEDFGVSSAYQSMRKCIYKKYGWWYIS